MGVGCRLVLVEEYILEQGQEQALELVERCMLELEVACMPELVEEYILEQGQEQALELELVERYRLGPVAEVLYILELELAEQYK